MDLMKIEHKKIVDDIIKWERAHPTATDTDRKAFLLMYEDTFLDYDYDFYIECIDTPLNQRESDEDIRNGLIKFHHVYMHIRGQK